MRKFCWCFNKLNSRPEFVMSCILRKRFLLLFAFGRVYSFSLFLSLILCAFSRSTTLVITIISCGIQRAVCILLLAANARFMYIQLCATHPFYNLSTLSKRCADWVSILYTPNCTLWNTISLSLSQWDSHHSWCLCAAFCLSLSISLAKWFVFFFC